MINILLGAGTFAAVLGFTVAFLVKRKGFSYGKEWWLFSLLFLSASVALLIFVPDAVSHLQSFTGVLHTSVVVSAFVLLQYRWHRVLGDFGGYGYLTIPESTRSFLHLSEWTAVSKVCEIVLQQVCALVIVLGLQSLGVSLVSMGALFMVVVFILHIPAPHWFGKIYGNYFLFASTLFAPFIPYLILSYTSGFYLALSLHIFMYIVLYGIAYLKSGR